MTPLKHASERLAVSPGNLPSGVEGPASDFIFSGKQRTRPAAMKGPRRVYVTGQILDASGLRTKAAPKTWVN